MIKGKLFLVIVGIVILLKVSLAWTPGSAAGRITLDLLRDTVTSTATDPTPILVSRHDFFQSLGLMLAIAAGPPLPPSRSGVDAGGGVDLLASPTLGGSTIPADVVFPSSMEGVWTCQRAVTSVEGDLFMAETVWRSLGAGNQKNVAKHPVETYSTRFVQSPIIAATSPFVVMDRGFELASRSKGLPSSTSSSSSVINNDNIVWKVEEPNQLLSYDKRTRLDIVRRQVEIPTDEGFGFSELVRITDGPFVRAAQVKRRYRRAFDADGNRVVQGLEIIKTFRVLDGVAGTDVPTATIKSTILMTRPTNGGGQI
jgi:hypothetical protein